MLPMLPGLPLLPSLPGPTCLPVLPLPVLPPLPGLPSLTSLTSLAVLPLPVLVLQGSYWQVELRGRSTEGEGVWRGAGGARGTVGVSVTRLEEQIDTDQDERDHPDHDREANPPHPGRAFVHGSAGSRAGFQLVPSSDPASPLGR